MNIFPKDIGRGITGFVVLIGSFGYFYIVSQGYISIDWKDVIMMITGSLITQVTTIVQWSFGSSKGSEKKTDALINGIGS